MLYIILLLVMICVIASTGIFGRLSDGELISIYFCLVFVLSAYYYLLYKKSLLAKILLIIDGVVVFVVSFIAIEKMPMIALANIGLFTLSVCLFRSKEEYSKILLICTIFLMSVTLFNLLKL